MKSAKLTAMKRRFLLTLRSEFRNCKREKLYFQQEMERTLSYIRSLFLILGIIYFLFIIPDMALIRNPHTFRLILTTRLVMVLFVLLLWFKLPKLVSADRYIFWLTAYEVLFSVSFLVIYSLYESPNLLIQSWGVILIILAFFLLPNRLLHSVSVSIFLYIGFFIIALRVQPVVIFREMAAACTYPLIIIIFSTIVTSRFNYYKRLQYLYAQRLSYLSTHDTLTGLSNRSKFEGELYDCISLAKRYGTTLSLIFYDFDDFKKVNDKFGHPMGDYLLRTQGKLVKKYIREGDTLARWGGEEFAIILPHTDLEGALKAAAKIKAIISEYAFKTGNITCSMGVTSYHEFDTKDTMMSRVDKLLYMAKHAGKDGIASDLDTLF
jgi:diguanylate cyclase (GGDEF)-like protein